MRKGVLAAGALFGTLASTAATAQPGAAAPSPLPTDSRSAAVTVAPNGSVPHFPTGVTPTEWRAKKLLGSDIYGPDNKVIGDVSDLIIDLNGRISAFVVSIGGFLGIGVKHVAIPIEDIKIGQDGHLTVNFTEAQLEKAPDFDFGNRVATRAGPMTAPGVGSGTSSSPR